MSTELTADHAYVRFHGRNYDIWYRGEKEDDHRLDRYDYLYKKEQLEPWGASNQGGRIEGRQGEDVLQQSTITTDQVREERLSADGYAPHEHKSKEIQLQDQFTLGEL